MEANITGLKCDNVRCDYRDDSIKFEDYPKHINAPCPKCGENLLTQKDYDTTVRLVKVVGRVEAVFNVLKWLNPFHYYRLIFGDKRKVQVLNFNIEDGVVKIKEQEPTEK